MIVGTSSGGIIALGLASGESTDTIVKLYKEKAGNIFVKRGWTRYLGYES